MARIHVVKEVTQDERRVAATPESVAKLCQAGHNIAIERGAGVAAGFADDAYEQAGATLADAAAIAEANIIVRVAPPTADEIDKLAPASVLVSFVAPQRNLPVVRALTTAGVTTVSMELIPRISRAQSMDALSSQANIAGYRAVITAAYELDKYFPLFMTAAGTIRPATVVVLGAGVAGLQAVATAKRLGAVVKVSDIREAAKDEVASLGATFIDVPEAEDLTAEGGYAKEVGEDFLVRQRAALTEAVSSAHAVIATAQIPLRQAPQLLTAEMVEAMPKGSVVIDLAAADGGNCALTDPSRIVEHGGVRIIPRQDFPSHMANEASALYARNISALIALLTPDGDVAVDRDDEVINGALLTHDGAVTNDRVAAMMQEAGA